MRGTTTRGSGGVRINGRTRYVLRRTLAALVIIFIATSVNFLLFRAVPGDASTSFGAVPGATKEVREQIRRDFGLGESLPQQYVRYMVELGHGNLGISFKDHEPVRGELLHALKNTVPLVLMAVIVAALLGIWLGTFAAWRRGEPVDHGLGLLGVVAYAAPIQWVGLMLVLAFSGTFASGGLSDPFLGDVGWWQRATDYLRHLTLPVATMAISLFGGFFILSRSAVVETLGEQYMLTARAKGLSESRLRTRYALRNAALPISTLAGLTLGYIAGGAVLVETVFSWPGIGRLLNQAVADRDYPMLQGGFLVLTISVVVATYLVDLLHLKLDPRIGTS
jgi:ABC-type dipeptide/oligopeptide/nickel transport system permease component